MKKELVVFANGVEVRTDKEGNICLTDLFKAAHEPDHLNPAQWVRHPQTVGFIDATCNILNVLPTHIIKSKRGRNGGTYAHKQIALAYAKSLSPELHYAVNQVFFERLEEEKNPQLAIDRAVATWQKQGKSEKWIGERLNGKATRVYFTNTLSKAGVKGIGFKNCTNAIYTPMYGGGASVIRAKKELAENTNTREHMTEIELAAIRLAELTASENIERKGLKGNKQCVSECLNSSTIIAKAVYQIRKS